MQETASSLYMSLYKPAFICMDLSTGYTQRKQVLYSMLLTRAPGNKPAPNTEQGLKKPTKKRVWDGETHNYTHRVKRWGIPCMPESCT